MIPQRIQRKRTKGWTMPPNTVSVCRPGPWGNPFPVTEERTAHQCVEAFRGVIQGKIYVCFDAENGSQSRLREQVRNHIQDLRGKNLACWCPIGQPCHADVLLEIANKEGRP